MLKKALWLIIPFILIFLLSLFQLLRPHYHVPIVEVVSTFTRQEKTGQRSSHRRSVDYANVVIELDGKEYTVTVHDNTWIPLKVGDSVAVTRGLFGKIVEYKKDEPLMLLMLSVTMGPACLLLFWIIARREKAVDRRDRTS